MEQDVSERFERIEAGLVSVNAALVAIAKSQMRLQEMLGEWAGIFASYAERADARMTRLEEDMKRMEENLDALIRAITAEHSNGRGKPG